MSTVVLTLQTPAGPFVFTAAEVPEHIAHGGTQAISVQRLIGGRRIVNPMGADEADITFSGLFAYQGTERSDFLDSLRRRGDLCTLSWDNRRMQVIVASYRPDYSKPYKIGYTITLLVVANEMALLDAVPAVSPAQQLQMDANSLSQRTGCLGNATLTAISSSISSALTAMQGVMQPVANGLRPITGAVGAAAACAAQVANEIQTATAAVAAPIAQLLANTQALISNTETAITEAATFGGVLPGTPVAQAVGTYLSQVNSIVQLPALYEIQSVAARMQANLALTGAAATAKTVTVAGGSLYDVAAKQYGDASRWQDIAQANGLNDPSISGIATLIIPA